MARTFEEWLAENLKITNSDDAIKFINKAIELEKKQVSKYGECKGIKSSLERVKERIVTKVVENIVLGVDDDRRKLADADTAESSKASSRRIHCTHVK